MLRLKHSNAPVAPTSLPRVLLHKCVWRRTRLPLRRCAIFAAATKEETGSTTLRSLDYLLGSRDEEDGAVADTEQQLLNTIQLLRVPTWAWSELQEPRVVPLASNVLYYTLLVVYTSYYVIQLADGQEVADDVLLRLVNDHSAVASGDSLRLFTSFFVADTVQQLIVALIALATVAAELESLLGYSSFWAIWCLTVLTGSVADAALSELPITAGPAAGVAGVAAALLAHHLHNWRVEALLQQAKEGEVPQSWLQLEGRYNARMLKQQRQQQQHAQLQQQPSGQANITSSSSSSSSSSTIEQLGLQQQQQQQPSPARASEFPEGDDSTLVATEIEGPMGLSFTLLLPKEGKAFITLGGTAVAVIAALKDAADADAATDWAALVAGFLAGGFLGWTACPVYDLELVPASSTSSSSSSKQRKAAFPSWLPVPGAAAAEQQQRQKEEEEEEEEKDQKEVDVVVPDLLLPVLRDVRRPAARANAVIGFAAALFAVLGGWLVSQGVFQ